MTKTVDIYDPAQCCATGACSPDADDELAQFASALEWLKERGISVSRYNLGHQPGAFAQNALVKGTLQSSGVGCLPLVLADGAIVSQGRYPTRDELAATLGLGAAAGPAAPAAAASCCAPAPAATGSACCAPAATATATVSAPAKRCCG
jgi:hypothetical protein